MKAKTGFSLRQVCGEYIIVAEGDENIDFSSIISMNETSAYLWKTLSSKDSFTVDDMVQSLMSEYDVDHATARRDCLQLAARWGEAKIIEGDDVPVLQQEAMDNNSIQTSTVEKESKNKQSKGFFGKLFRK